MVMKKIYFIFKFFDFIGKRSVSFVITLGVAVIFLFSILFSRIDLKKNKYEFIRQFYFIAFLSLGLIVISSLFIGFVVGLQACCIVQSFGSHDFVGKTSSLTIVRELGPVVTAILFTGRTGASLTAEISLMKTTDQLAAMEMMGISYIKKIIAPRFWCSLFAMFFLSAIFMILAILGCYVSSVLYLNIDHYVYLSSIKENLSFRVDIINSLFKSFIFGFIITWISLFQGVISNSTNSGIAKSTTNTVVYSIFIILVLNFFLTLVMFGWK